MGIIENVIGSLVGGSSGTASPGMGTVLSSILGGGQTTGTAQGGMNPQGSIDQGGIGQGGMGGGGIGGLVSMFEQAGLGHIIQSWIGSGSNSSVSPDQLNQVFGNNVSGMAQQAGMNQGDFLNELSQHLPNAVNSMTPDGQVPQQQDSYNV